MNNGTPFWRVVASIIRKDFQAELRSRELIGSMGLFALLSVVVFSFALDLDRNAKVEAVNGVLWATMIFASIIGLNRSMALERDQGNLDALLLAPINRAAIFVGKLVGNFLFTLMIALLLLPIMTALYNISLFNGWLIAVLVMGTLGFTTIGTLLSAMTVQTRAREAMLPIVMMPIVLPLLMTGVMASNGILNDSAQSNWQQWVAIVAVLDLIYLTICFLLFEYVLEE
jgi:heme exporter protein B